MLVETFLRKQLGLQAHTVTKVEETERYMIVHIDRLGRRFAALWGLPAAMSEGAQRAQTKRMARSVDAENAVETVLPAASGRVPPVRPAVEDLPWAHPWARVTTARCRMRWQDWHGS